MSYLHIPNSGGNGEQRLGKVTYKSSRRTATTNDTTQAGTSNFSKLIKGPSGLIPMTSTSINPRAGAYNGVTSVGFSSVSGTYNSRFHQ